MFTGEFGFLERNSENKNEKSKRLQNFAMVDEKNDSRSKISAREKISQINLIFQLKQLPVFLFRRKTFDC